MSGASDLADVIAALAADGMAMTLTRPAGASSYDPATGQLSAGSAASRSIQVLPTSGQVRGSDNDRAQTSTFYCAGNEDIAINDRLGDLTVKQIEDTVSGGVVVMLRITASNRTA